MFHFGLNKKNPLSKNNLDLPPSICTRVSINGAHLVRLRGMESWYVITYLLNPLKGNDV
jgi:hypothetical protein